MIITLSSALGATKKLINLDLLAISPKSCCLERSAIYN